MLSNIVFWVLLNGYNQTLLSLFVAWLICIVGGGILLRRALPTHDPFLFPVACLMTGWGLLAIFRISVSMSVPFAPRQALWMFVSMGVMLGITYHSYALKWLQAYKYVLFFSGLGLLLATVFLGTNPSGLAFAPRLWLGFRQVYFQPSEPLKIILIAFSASYLREYLHQPSKAQTFFRLDLSILGPPSLMIAFTLGLLVWQRDLGTAIVFFVVFLLLLYTATHRLELIAVAVFITLASGWIAYETIATARTRFEIWLNPWGVADSNGYQIVQSLIAIASGGLYGAGFSLGFPDYIPVAHSDFIFAVIAEEWGLLGALVLLLLTLTVVLRGFKIARQHAHHSFYALLAIGLSVLLAIQSLLIVGGIITLVPLTGVTYPFVSYGGSSLLTSFVALGILLRLSSTKPL